MLRLLSIISVMLIAGQSLAQNGSVTGVVTDAASGETVVGANVVIENTTVGAATDLDGRFTIGNIKPGTYNLQVTFVTYKTHRIPDVVIEAGKITTVGVKLQEDVSELAEVVVTGTREINNDIAMIKAIKESKLVVSGISAEQIVRLPDRDAAQIAQRVPGITIADNRFILIRGVPERYNQVMVNGIIGPSTEIDKRSFSFDLIPSVAIDQMLIFKSGSPDMPGDFAGGVIQMITKKPTQERFVNASVNVGYRSNTTFRDYYSSAGSGTDGLGFDNGFRDLPSTFPTTSQLQSANRTSSLRMRAGKSLTNNFGYDVTSAPVDRSAGLTFSHPFSIGGIRVNNLTVLGYSSSYQHYGNTQFKRYVGADSKAGERFSYSDNFYSNDVRLNVINNWSVEINDAFKVEFKNMFVQLGENETTIRSGNDTYQLSGYDRQNYAYHYLSRSIYSGQLEGTHQMKGQSTLNWVFGMNDIARNEPDYRRFRTIREISLRGSEAPFLMQLPSAGNLFETGRFWSDLKDRGLSHGLNFEKKFGMIDVKRQTIFRAGYFAERKTRSFNARYINYLYPDGPEFDPARGESLRSLPLDEIFSPANISNENGFVIEEGTTRQDHYNGENVLAAAFAGISHPIGKFDLSGGLRGEYNRQQLFSESNQGEDIHVNNPVFAPLPMINIAFNITDRSLVRGAFSRTINRPEFRELAPFLYYQFEYEVAIYGNPDLKTAFVNNVDVRWEMYPNPGESVSAGVFYKSFTDPIETYLQITSENPQLVFGNAPSAANYGVEVEVRKSLASLGVSRFLRNTSVNLNASMIRSMVDIGNTATNQFDRPMQGQSPYIVNAGVYYADDATGFSFNTAYNVFGPRIFSVGDVNFPSWWELPRHSLDVQISRIWKQRFETKLNIQNLLNTPYRIYQDDNNDNRVSTEEGLIQAYRVGTQFSMGLSYRFIR